MLNQARGASLENGSGRLVDTRTHKQMCTDRAHNCLPARGRSDQRDLFGIGVGDVWHWRQRKLRVNRESRGGGEEENAGSRDAEGSPC